MNIEAQHLNSNAVNLICRDDDLRGAYQAINASLSKLSWCVLSPDPIGTTEERHGFVINSTDATTVKIMANPNIASIVSTSVATCTTYQSTTTSATTNTNPTATTTTTRENKDMWNGWCARDTRNEIFPHPFSYDIDVDQHPDRVDLQHGQSKKNSTECNIGNDAFFEEMITLTSSQYTCCQIVTLFNLSLVYHLEWMRQQQQSSSMDTVQKVWLLQEALQGYESLFQVVCTQKCPLVTTKQYPLSGVIMAACTNAAQACTELLLFDAAHRWNRRLVFMLELCNKLCSKYSVTSKKIQAAESTTRIGACPALPQSHHSFFVINATIGSLRRKAAQAA